MVRLARALLAAHRRPQAASRLADMADLERCALALLRDGDLAGWVQERLDARVRHVLIDEFQDTSPLQWHALHAWLSAYAGAGGGASGQRPPSVFIVGDPKQSIYRFRRAEPRVFEAAARFRGRGARRPRPGLRPHLPQCAAGDRGDQPVFEAAADEGEFEGFRAHSTARPEQPATASGGCLVSARPEKNRAASAARFDAAWRDTLLTPAARARRGAA